MAIKTTTISRPRGRPRKIVQKIEVYEKKKPTMPYLEAVKRASLFIATNTEFVPCFYGPTSAGKTYLVKELAEEIEAHLVIVLLGKHTPDEVCGFQVLADKVLIAQDPYWWREAEEFLLEHPDKPVIIFLDELDKAKEETTGPIYTVIRSKKLNNKALPGQAIFMAACNPAPFKGGLRSRLAFIHVPLLREKLIEIANGRLLTSYAASIVPLEIPSNNDPEYSNEAPPEPPNGNAAYTNAFAQCEDTPDFWRMPQEMHEIIISAFWPRVTAEEILRKIYSDIHLDIDALVKVPDILMKTILQLDTPKAVNLALSVYSKLNHLDISDDEIAVFCVVQEALSENVDKLQAYHEVEKPKKLLDNIMRIDAEKMAKYLQDNDLLYVRLENASIVGKIGQNLMAQAEIVEENN